MRMSGHLEIAIEKAVSITQNILKLKKLVFNAYKLVTLSHADGFDADGFDADGCDADSCDADLCL